MSKAKCAALMRVCLDPHQSGEQNRVACPAQHRLRLPYQAHMRPEVVRIPLQDDVALASACDSVLRVGQVLASDPPDDTALRSQREGPAGAQGAVPRLKTPCSLPAACGLPMENGNSGSKPNP